MAPSESAAQTPTQVLPRGPGVLRFAVAGFCNALSTGFFYPFSLLFYVSLSGEELRTVGTVLTVTALAALPSLLLVGRVVDRVGPRPVLIASLVVRAGCFVSFVTFGGAAALAVGTLALAVSTRAEQTATPLVALQLAPEGQSSRWLALSRVVFNAGMGVGALIAGIFIVDSASGFALLGIANAVGILCTAALYAVVPRTPRPAHSAARVRIKARPWRDHKFLLIAVVNALLLVSALAVESGMPVYVLQELAMPTWTVGMLFAVNTGVLTALQLPVSRVLDRHPPVRVLAFGGLTYLSLYAALLAAARTDGTVRMLLLVLGMVVYTLGELAVTQAALVLLTGLPPDSRKGAYLGFNQIFVGASTAVAPLLVTYSLAGNPPVLWWSLAGVSVVSTAVLLGTERRFGRGASEGVAGDTP
ncbi:MFS transporter [Streptomyces albidoflavus]